ncbi:MAG: phosphotransferase [Pseudomonadota bacterium]
MTRDAAIAAFLEAAGWGTAERRPLAGDASMRRYDRLTRGTARAVLMDAPPDRGEDIAPFVDVTHRLRRTGLSAPEILAEDPGQGLLLLEDLGDDLYARVIANGGADEWALYDAAIDLLVDLQRETDTAGLLPYDAAAYRAEAALLTDWYMPAATGKETPIAVRNEGLDLVTAACPPPVTPVITLRDYHAENLVWLPKRAAHARVGLLDYQDALAGHPAYDLVSLLEDARRDTTAELRARGLARYLAASGYEEHAFRAAYAGLGAQRNMKIIGIFARLWLRDGKPAYLDLMGRVWAHLERDLTHPALAGLKAWVEAHVPPPSDAVRARLRAAGGGS